MHPSMHYDFLGSEGLQGTHMDALNLFILQSITLIMREVFFTKFAIVLSQLFYYLINDRIISVIELSYLLKLYGFQNYMSFNVLN